MQRIEHAIIHCFDMYILANYEGLLQLEGLMCGEIGTEPALPAELHRICKSGILDAKEWQTIEAEAVDYCKTHKWTKPEKEFLRMYLNSYRMIQNREAEEKLMTFLASFMPERERQNTYQKLEDRALAWKNGEETGKSMEKARALCRFRQEEMMRRAADGDKNSLVLRRTVERFNRQFPKPVTGDFEIGFGILDFFPDDRLEETIRGQDLRTLTAALIFADGETLERFLWLCSADVWRYLAGEWNRRMESYADGECREAMNRMLCAFYERSKE